MGKSRGTTAFYIETLMLILFLLASLAVLVQLMGKAREFSRAAQELDAAVRIAQDAAEQFAAAGGEDWAGALGAQPGPGGLLVAGYGPDGLPLAEGGAQQPAYLLQLRQDCEQQGAGAVCRLHLAVLRGQDGQLVYELDTCRYRPARAA